jgi:succinate dehydrogenase / fumarate reductase flavoprotein subunit
MADYSAGADAPPPPDDAFSQSLKLLDGFLARDRLESPADIRRELQETLFDDAFVVRSEESLTRASDTLANLRDRYDTLGVQDKGSVYNTDLMETVELGFLLDCADTLVAAARDRTESRGAHYREDHPLRDDANWMKHSLAYRKDGGAVRLEYKPVQMGPYVPMERKY